MSLAEMVRQVETAVADLTACTDGELVEALAATERVRSSMAAHAAALMSACDHRRVPAAEGSASPGVWLARVCDQRAAEGRRLVRQARRLESMPVTAAAFVCGEIGEAKASLLVAARTERLADEFDRCEATLVDAAKRLDADGLATVIARWRHAASDAVAADPSAVEADDDPQSRPSEVFLSATVNGRYVLSGDLSFEDGAILAHGIETQMRSLFQRGGRLSDGTTFEPAHRRAVGLVETFKRGVTAGPEKAAAEPLLIGVVDLELLTRRNERDRLRTLDQLGDSTSCTCSAAADLGPTEDELDAISTRVDTLITIACARRGQPPPPRWRPCTDTPPGRSRERATAADQTAGIGARPRGQQAITAGHDDPGPSVPRTTPAGLAAPSTDRRGGTDPFDLAGLGLVAAPDPADPFDLGRCEIPGIGPMPVEMARRLACNGRVARLVLGADSAPLDYGRAKRLATTEQRHALIARDGGCTFPGCDRAPAWCEAHHLDFWDDHDGPTDLANLALLCRHHHHCVHEWHWTLERTPAGWTATGPTGERLHRAVPR